uniref:NADH-ubiquinone oxidoreductase chain 4 n=1 Tax=Pseudo-nitzschia multiseries TaxID=37319 RepID=A0A0G3F1S2_PSEMU|nr:NADH dehydrogenase subunit 4 [Pseudo-nitzschia multiseries]AKJ77332.1 NADH dehydrogenase subunit 4 [Pseudo-nitzschia multiseries]
MTKISVSIKKRNKLLLIQNSHHIIKKISKMIYFLGVSPSGKAIVFGTIIQRFESFYSNMDLISTFYFENILVYTSFIPLIGILLLISISSEQQKLLKVIALNFSAFPFLIFVLLWGGFKKSVGTFQFVTKILWIPILNLNVTLGVDGISLFFLLLTTLLIPLCILISWNSIQVNLKGYLIAFLSIEFFLIGVFCVLDVLMFYIFFESILIPMFLVIGIWGSRERKIWASYYFFLYTLLGSVVMLLSILYIYNQVGTTDYEILLTFAFSDLEQKLLWFTFFLAFAAKVPMMPVHLWLPEAHVEAPTAGSVILAGVLLKLGTYGFIRFSLPLFPQASFYFAPFVYTISLIGIVYASLTAIRQTDFKRIIAYTSVAHMNVVMLGIFSFNNVGIEGALLQSLSHGFVASALFVIIGVVYERYRTRLVKYYGGLVHTMPLYISIFLFFTMANIGLPGTSGFIGEFLIFAGSFKVNSSVTFFGATGMILGGCYALWLFNRIAYGNLKSQYIKETLDINKREFYIFAPLIFYTLVFGLTPDPYLNSIHMSVNNLIENMYF